MQHFSDNPSAAYRKVDLDARIESSPSEDLTRICLEEVMNALNQALLALSRSPDAAPRDALARAHSIALFLARSVSPENPFSAALTQFYGGQAAVIGRNMQSARVDEITKARDDFADLLKAALSA